MCGILGTTKKIEQKQFETSLFRLSHRGPDDSGVYKHGNVLLGHRRLAIIDLSPLGHQPMVSRDGTVALIFNGEIYNFQDLKKELETLGEKFVSTSDTEVILIGYQKFGLDFFTKLRGMWAFALSDLKNNTIILSRDYFGIKPLYFSVKNGLSFGSELSGIVSLLGSVVPNRDMYKLYYRLGMMPRQYSAIQDVFQVLPGQVLVYNVQTAEIFYQSLLNIFNDFSDVKSNTIEEALFDSVKQHYVSDVSVGLLLSGGTDSSLLAALSVQQGFRPECFHVAISGSEDTFYAEKIAKHLGLSLTVLPFDKSALYEAYDNVLTHLDTPLSDISLMPTSLVFNAVGKSTKVVLSGEGGDEFFGGYLRHQTFKGASYKTATYAIPYFHNSSLEVLEGVNPIHYRLQKALDGIRKDIVGLYLDEVSLLYDPGGRKDVIDYLKSVYDAHELHAVLPENLFFDVVLYLPDILLVKNDRMSMMYGVEARVPFLDKEVFRAAQKLNILENTNYSGGSKKILKDVLQKYVPEDLVHRKKSGFSLSVEQFMEEQIQRDFIEAVKFHEAYDEFAWSELELPKSSDVKFYLNLFKKFPRFAFAIITNHAVWKRYGF